MSYSDKRYIIGIDLGTTNSAVSFVDLQAEYSDRSKSIKIFKVPQLTGAGEFSGLPVLPSFLYIPGTYDISKEAVSIPWQTDEDNFVGAFARDHGAKVPARLVSSAKSWLCHSNADRRAKILPWGSGDEVYKVSPVQATASYLKHIRKAWNSTKGDDADQYLENQVIIITVPASFDEVARDLTLEAATLAGLTGVTLLEEPLAAFYNWLINHEKHWSEYVKPGELILVCDVGGGTTDFTLITLREVEGSPRFERIAVGDHLVLGGDNVDLALARRIEMRFSKKKLSLNPDRWKALCHQCRQAKEIILDNKAESKRITLMGEGSKLISSTLSAELKREEVEETVLEGFFPLSEQEIRDIKKERKGITEFGLPYEQEPAITRHMGWFLERHRQDVSKILDRENYAPDLILFNGGSLKSQVVQERIRAAIRRWFKKEDTTLPRILENPDPDLSVALGASYYGLVKIGEGVRVGSGSARSYYLGVETPETEPQTENRKALCLVERGLDEGSHIELKNKKFEVLANQPVSFDVYSSSFRSGDRCGDLVETDDSLTSLPPIRTIVQYGKKGVKTSIPVQIEADYTEMGTLALWCRSCVSDHRWQLQFQLRDASSQAEKTGVSEEEVFEESVVENVRAKVRTAFSDKAEARYLDSLVREISNVVEKTRDKWPLGLIRNMADELVEVIPVSNVTNKFESRWLNLTGFCMRPGFGDGFDEHRMKQLWKLHKKGPIHANNPQVRSEWWIFWRRIAGGLKSGQQRQFIQELTPVMMPKKGTKTKIPPQELLEIWMAVANMESLLVKDKVKWGRQLLSEIQPNKCKPQHLWSLSRMGARELLYGSVDRVIPPGEVCSWIETVLSKQWKNPKPVGAALAQLARKTGDRIRDIDSSVADKVVDWMSQHEFPASQVKVVKEVVAMEKQEENTIFGESLPSGLVLHSEAQ
ncbi:MAG: hsp70 family protein [Desulfobacteraceae bacterium]|nr:hsp70 family protein [Desulfobacteraceae bacterium]